MGYVRNKIRASRLARRNPDELIPSGTRIELTFPDGQVFEAFVVSHDYDDDEKTRPLLDCLIGTGANDKFDGFRQGSNLDTRRDVSVRSFGQLVEMSQRDLAKWFSRVPKLGSDLLKPYQVRALTKKAKHNGQVECPKCEGVGRRTYNGRLEHSPCFSCQGTGRIEDDQLACSKSSFLT